MSDNANSNVAFSFVPILFTCIRVILPVSKVLLLDGFSKTIIVVGGSQFGHCYWLGIHHIHIRPYFV